MSSISVILRDTLYTTRLSYTNLAILCECVTNVYEYSIDSKIKILNNKINKLARDIWAAVPAWKGGVALINLSDPPLFVTRWEGGNMSRTASQLNKCNALSHFYLLIYFFNGKNERLLTLYFIKFYVIHIQIFFKQIRFLNLYLTNTQLSYINIFHEKVQLVYVHANPLSIVTKFWA